MMTLKRSAFLEQEGPLPGLNLPIPLPVRENE
jgi:hypothetical protein